jgi:hypothetical protein
VVVIECDQREDRGVRLYLRAGDALLCFAQAEEDGRDSQSFAPALFGWR